MIGTAHPLEDRVRELGPWFHDLDLKGIRTAPTHPLGPFLQDLWALVEPALPVDMTGESVLDIGCNAGFYSLQLARRGADVTGIDVDPRYLDQARFAADVLGQRIDYRCLDVYRVDELGKQFDYVLFMGVFYHLRYPLLALDKVAKLPRKRLVFQTMVRGRPGAVPCAPDYPITDLQVFEDPLMPAMYFIEHSYAGDPTNWWIPNESAVEAMLRSAGLCIEAHPAREVYLCSPAAG